jgi:hypothetical protein
LLRSPPASATAAAAAAAAAALRAGREQAHTISAVQALSPLAMGRLLRSTRAGPWLAP